MRKDLFELISNKDIDLRNEYIRIRTLFECTRFDNNHSILDYIQEYYFSSWKYRKRYLTIDELMQDLELNKEKMYDYIDTKKLLLYIELVYNMLNLCWSDSLTYSDHTTMVTLDKNIYDLLEDMNYTINHIEDRYIIVEKNSLTTAVAELKPKLTSTVIEYRRFAMNGNIEGKKAILKVLADEIEPLREKFRGTNYNSIVDDTFYLINNLNIRHNNLEGKSKLEYVSTMSNEELEKWYDKIYDMILGIFVLEKYLNEKDEITKLKGNLV